MKIQLPNFDFDQKFLELRQTLKIPEGYFVKYGSTPSLKLPNEITVGSLSKSEVKVTKSNLLYKEYPDGRRDLVLMHIFSYSEHEPKFHFADCSTLIDQRRKNGFSRYVETHRTDGFFDVDYVGSLRELTKGRQIQKLKVCQNCLSRVNYKGFSSYSSKQEKFQAVQNFDVEEFFRTYTVSLFSEKAIPSYLAQSNQYPSNWSSLSKETRKKAGWKCSQCEINLSHPNYHKFLDVHHIDRQKFNNMPSNLKVLCVKCHSLQLGHERMRASDRYHAFHILLN